MAPAKTLTNHGTRSASTVVNKLPEMPALKRFILFSLIITITLGQLSARHLVNMASNSPPKSSTTTVELEEYVHQVSGIKTPTSGTRYSLVKLLNVSPQKRKFDPNTQEYRLNNYSKVVVTRRVPYPWKDISAALAEASVKSILDSCIPGDIVSLKAKVLHKSNEQSVYSKTNLKNCDIIVADTTGPILITLWEVVTANVNINTYNFEWLKVAFYNNKYLNSTSQTLVMLVRY